MLNKLLSPLGRVTNKLLDWLTILMLLVVTLVVPTYIESLF